MGPAQDLYSYPTRIAHLRPAEFLHSKLHRSRTVPAHDFYIQTSNNILKPYLRNCEGPAQNQQVFVTCFAFLKISKNTLNICMGPAQDLYSYPTRNAHLRPA